jgi:hypothetical protein
MNLREPQPQMRTKDIIGYNGYPIVLELNIQ